MALKGAKGSKDECAFILDKSLLQRLGYCRTDRVYLQFLIDIGNVLVDGSVSDEALVSDHFIAVSFDQQAQDLLLSIGQFNATFGRSVVVTVQQFQDLTGHGWRHWSAAIHHFLDTVQ